jgi:hypothetical protein
MQTNRRPRRVICGDVPLLGQPEDALFEDELGVAGAHVDSGYDMDIMWVGRMTEVVLVLVGGEDGDGK